MSMLLAAAVAPAVRQVVPASSQVAPASSQIAPTPGRIAPGALRRVDRFLAVHRRRLGLPGLAVGIGTADSVVFARGYGHGSLDGGIVTGDTPFFLGSVTKTFTAFAVVRLAEEGRVDLDAPVERYLPDFALAPPWVPESLTIRHLLHHRSGLAQWDGHDRVAQTLGRFDDVAPANEPGGRFEYSSLNYIILGRVVEQVAGVPYGQVLQTTLFDPLGMDDAFVEAPGRRPPDRAQGHRSVYGFFVPAEEPEVAAFLVPAGYAGASARDMARYVGMLVGRGTFDTVGLTRLETVDALLSPMPGGGPAMAWGRWTARGTPALGHSGNTRTSSARVRLLPEAGYGIALLTNAPTGPFFDSSEALLDGVHGILDGAAAPSLWPVERIFKAALLASVLWSVWGLGREAHRWRRAGHPRRLDTRPRVLARLALDLALGGFLLIGLPRLMGVPLGTIVEYMPDLGLALVVSVGAGVAAGILRALGRPSPA